jgi:hypothetical protein
LSGSTFGEAITETAGSASMAMATPAPPFRNSRRFIFDFGFVTDTDRNYFFDAARFRENWFSTAFIYRRFYAFYGAGQCLFWLFAPARRCCRFLSAGRPILAGVPSQNRQAVGSESAKFRPV